MKSVEIAAQTATKKLIKPQKSALTKKETPKFSGGGAAEGIAFKHLWNTLLQARKQFSGSLLLAHAKEQKEFTIPVVRKTKHASPREKASGKMLTEQNAKTEKNKTISYEKIQNLLFAPENLQPIVQTILNKISIKGQFLSGKNMENGAVAQVTVAPSSKLGKAIQEEKPGGQMSGKAQNASLLSVKKGKGISLKLLFFSFDEKDGWQPLAEKSQKINPQVLKKAIKIQLQSANLFSKTKNQSSVNLTKTAPKIEKSASPQNLQMAQNTKSTNKLAKGSVENPSDAAKFDWIIKLVSVEPILSASGHLARQGNAALRPMLKINYIVQPKEKAKQGKGQASLSERPVKIETILISKENEQKAPLPQSKHLGKGDTRNVSAKIKASAPQTSPEINNARTSAGEKRMASKATILEPGKMKQAQNLKTETLLAAKESSKILTTGSKAAMPFQTKGTGFTGLTAKIQALILQAKNAQGGQGNRLKLQIEESPFGKMNVQFEQKENRMTVVLESEKARQAFLHLVPVIQNNLADKGIALSGFQVNVEQFMTQNQQKQSSDKRKIHNQTPSIGGKEEENHVSETALKNRNFGYNTLEIIA